MKECSSLTRFVGVKITLMCEICICKNMMTWALCVWKKARITTNFLTRVQRDCEQKVLKVWLWSLKKRVLEHVVELSKSIGFSSGLLIDYGLGNDHHLIALHGVFAFEIGWIIPLFSAFKWSSYWLWFRWCFNISPWCFCLWIWAN